jgi:hypothetical protein
VYLALVEGHPDQESGTVRNWLKENSAMQVFVATERTPGRQLAVSHYRVLKTYASKSLLEVRIETAASTRSASTWPNSSAPSWATRSTAPRGNPHPAARPPCLFTLLHPPRHRGTHPTGSPRSSGVQADGLIVRGKHAGKLNNLWTTFLPQRHQDTEAHKGFFA